MLETISHKALRACADLTSRASDGSGHRLLTLIYHRVLAEHDYMRPDEVTLAKFEWQMELLARYFRVYPLSEALQLQQAGELPARSVAITFDDGYADNYQTALPVLRRFGLHATFFVASGYLDGGRMWNDSVLEGVRLIEHDKLDLSEEGMGVLDLSSTKRKAEAGLQILRIIKHRNSSERARLADLVASRATDRLPDNLMMTSQELKKLSDSGMEIGGHTVSHPILATLSAEESRREIVHGKQALEAIVDQPVSLFAYPNGKADADFQRKDAENVSKSGFYAAVTTHWGVAERSTDPFQLPRFTPWDATPTRFMTRMASMYRNVVH
jgi:peptidoglycan/xylan/chitin deacetylase (PgdA/CDA1 family)